MRKITTFLLCVLGATLIMNTYAQHNDPNAYALMTARDVKDGGLSNITINNGTNQDVSITGLYIASFDVNDCSHCFGNVVSGDNLGGAVITSPLSVKAGQAIPIGENYLYNMLYNGIYYIKNTVGSSPCSLPGCSWHNDDATDVHGWCISINAVSVNSNYTYSNYTSGAHPAAASPPYASAGDSIPYNYKYALVNPATLGVGNSCIGPIVCNDKTLTCKTSTAQNETFRPY